MPTQGKQQARAALVQLGIKVEAHVEGVTARHGARMSCARGCHACCQPGLTVGPAEAALIRTALEDPQRRQRVLEVARQNPWNGTRCALLDADGACTIYDARPLVCRSHGVPQQVQDGDARRLDVCELNFTDVALETLEARDVLDLDTLHTVLAVVHARFDPDGHEERVALTADALLG